MSEVLTAKEKLDKVFTDIAKAINDTDNNGAMSPEDMAERIETIGKKLTGTDNILKSIPTNEVRCTAQRNGEEI